MKIYNNSVFWHDYDPEDLRNTFEQQIDELLGTGLWIKVRSVRDRDITYYYRFVSRDGDKIITNYITGEELNEYSFTEDKKYIKWMLKRTFDLDLSNITNWYMIDIPIEFYTTADLMQMLEEE